MAGSQGRRGAGWPEDLRSQQDDISQGPGFTHKAQVSVRPSSAPCSVLFMVAVPETRLQWVPLSPRRQPGQGGAAAFTKADLKV